MSDAKKILEMIEDVSPDDSAKLDEIDCMVWKLLYPNGGNYESRMDCVPDYTCSRDALKDIRPAGWDVEIFGYHDGGCECTIRDNGWDKLASRHILVAPTLPTEELAELHAVIQAIECERNQK